MLLGTNNYFRFELNSLEMFSSIFSLGFHFLCPRIQPNFTNAVSGSMSLKKMIPVFCKSLPAEYMFGFNRP